MSDNLIDVAILLVCVASSYAIAFFHGKSHGIEETLETARRRGLGMWFINSDDELEWKWTKRL